MDKPFKTTKEQIMILQSRNLQVRPGMEEILEREGYYSIINGYKDLYLDPNQTGSRGEDVYFDGTSFDDIYDLFCFDRDLRQTLFPYFAKAEATLKTQCAYHFAEAHQHENEAYLNSANYDKYGDQKRIKHLIDDFEFALGRSSKGKPKQKAYMTHYVNNHDEVPVWVLLRYATFGQAYMFYCFQPESVRNRIAKGFSILKHGVNFSQNKISQKRLSTAYSHIKDFRNLCAHEERLYCSKVAPNETVPLVKVFGDLRLVLSTKDHTALIQQTTNLLLSMQSKMAPWYFDRLLKAMGADSMMSIIEAK